MRVAVSALCLFLVGAMPAAAADTPKFELAPAYAFMHDADRAEDFRAGWALSAIGNVNNWAGVVTEVGGSHHTCRDCQRGPFASQSFRGTDRDIRVYTFMAGPRVASHAFSAVTPFAQVLFGGSHISGGVEFDGALNSGFTYQPGAGIDVGIGRRLGLRLEGDYRVIRTSGRNNRQSRVMAGVVVRSSPR